MALTFSHMLDDLFALIYPPRCAACRQFLPPGRSWCPDCWVDFAHATDRAYCPTCGSNLGPHQPVNSKGRCSLCQKDSAPLTAMCRLGTYETSLAAAIKGFKYHHAMHTGRRLGDMLGNVLKQQSWCGAIHALCPIPIHWTRRLDRGFNQAQILADRVAQGAHLPVLKLLRRIKPTPKQVNSSLAARRTNLKDAFTAAPRWPRTRSYPLDGASVCLIDDVMTTGSTLFEAARTLRRAGVAHVYAAILAKADRTGYEA